MLLRERHFIRKYGLYLQYIIPTIKSLFCVSSLTKSQVKSHSSHQFITFPVILILNYSSKKSWNEAKVRRGSTTIAGNVKNARSSSRKRLYFSLHNMLYCIITVTFLYCEPDIHKVICCNNKRLHEHFNKLQSFLWLF